MFLRPAEHRGISVRDARDDANTPLLCDYFEFGSPLAEVLLAALPAGVVMHGCGDTKGSEAASLLTLIMHEASGDAPGAAAVLDELSDALSVQMLRHCL